MTAWDDIVNKASLGSEKAPVTTADLPAEIASGFVVEDSLDKEDTFLKIAALVYQFRQSGALPVRFNQVAPPEAATESQPYCSARSNALLKTLIGEDVAALISYWIACCRSMRQLAHPEMIPSLLSMAERTKELRPAILDIVGERGKWLCGLNPSWNFSTPGTDAEQIWSDGSTEERKELLHHLRRVDPDRGRKLVESSWASEGANEKVAFLDILKVNLSGADLPWLESLKEKGQKVNAAILDALKLIPTSAIVQEYQQVLSACTSVKTGKALLGMINKTEVVIHESFSFPDSIFKTGIEKLSSDKGISDGQHVIAQLLMSVPPSFLESHLQRTPGEIIDLLQKNKQTAFFLPAVSIASARFGDKRWTTGILDKGDNDLIRGSIVTLLSALDGEERNRYALKYFEELPEDIIWQLLTSDTEWPVELAKVVLKFTAREVHQYNKQFYRRIIGLLPASLLDRLDSFTPADDQRRVYWQSQRDEIARLLTLKQQTLESFQP